MIGHVDRVKAMSRWGRKHTLVPLYRQIMILMSRINSWEAHLRVVSCLVVDARRIQAQYLRTIVPTMHSFNPLT